MEPLGEHTTHPAQTTHSHADHGSHADHAEHGDDHPATKAAAIHSGGGTAHGSGGHAEHAGHSMATVFFASESVPAVLFAEWDAHTSSKYW